MQTGRLPLPYTKPQNDSHTVFSGGDKPLPYTKPQNDSRP